MLEVRFPYVECSSSRWRPSLWSMDTKVAMDTRPAAVLASVAHGRRCAGAYDGTATSASGHAACERDAATVARRPVVMCVELSIVVVPLRMCEAGAVR